MALLASPAFPSASHSQQRGAPLIPRKPCQVVSVHDGDTVRCATGEKIRLLLIDAPELSQKPFGHLAQKALASVTMGRRIWMSLDVQPKDQYGRTLAYLWPDSASNVLVNEQMAKAGFAVPLVYPPNVAYVERIRAASEDARRARRGLWSVDAFQCSPKDHRKRLC